MTELSNVGSPVMWIVGALQYPSGTKHFDYSAFKILPPPQNTFQLLSTQMYTA